MDKQVRMLIGLAFLVVLFHSNNVLAKGDVLVSTLVPISLFSIFPLCFFLLFLFRFRSIREKQITLRAMVENGAQIPPEMFMENKKDLNPTDRDRRRGLLFSLASLGFIACMLIIETNVKGLWAMGLVPLMMGFGYLMSWKLAEKDTKEEK